MISKTYILEHLGCANCAAKIEKKIIELPEVQEASITFATKLLRITAEDPDTLIPRIQKIANALEPDIVITERTRRNAAGSKRPERMQQELEACGCEHHHHDHAGHEEHDSCGCGCEHHHHEHTDHDESDSCGCGHEHHHHDHADISRESVVKSTESPSADHATLSDGAKDLIIICSGAALFLIGELLEHFGLSIPSFAVYLAGYLLLGGKILLTAGKNLLHGQIFDENFLMSIATLGALIIKEYPEAVGVMLFFRIGEYFEAKAVEKSRRQIMDAVDLRPENVQLIDGNKILSIPAEEALPGDLLLVRPGDRIPLDGTIVEGESRIDTSPVTGEPVPVKAVPGSAVISGCVNTSGLLKIRVEKVLEESMVTRILDSVENAAASKPKIDRFITRFARIYTPCVVLIALATAILPSLFTGNWDYWVYTALSFLVISCPCALVLSVPLAFFSGIGAGSKRGILFKGGASLEAMNQIKAIIMDKTGTITKGNFAVQKVIPNGADTSADQLLTWCAGCEQASTHPIGQSILDAAKEKGLEVPSPTEVEEIAGHGIRAVFPEGTLLCGNRKLMDQFGIKMKTDTDSGYGTEVYAAKDGIYIGMLIISDTLKEDAASAVSKLHKLGIVTAMLTGDSQTSAREVARQTGIDHVYARLLPEDKLNKLQEIRREKGAVMFVGDGINDAPVLAGADVGAAMGSGADAAIEAADVVFMTSHMEAIPQSLEIARATGRISWQNVIFALAVKILVMVLGLAGFASMWMAVFADTGVALLCILNSIRILRK